MNVCSVEKDIPTEVAVGAVAKRRPSALLGKANALGEETGMCTLEAAGVGDQTCCERSAEITSGRSDSQLGLAATSKDRLCEDTPS